MRAATEVKPVALLVDIQVLARRNRLDQFALEGLALGVEKGRRLIASPDFLNDGLVAAMISRIFFSMTGRSSGVKGVSRWKS